MAGTGKMEDAGGLGHLGSPDVARRASEIPGKFRELDRRDPPADGPHSMKVCPVRD